MSINYACEGDLYCPNSVKLTKEESYEHFNTDISILCEKCEIKYGHLSRKQNSELGARDL